MACAATMLDSAGLWEELNNTHTHILHDVSEGRALQSEGKGVNGQTVVEVVSKAFLRK